MVINLNNSHTNSFAKGMNSDQTYDQIDSAQYVYGKNLRITKNLLIGITSKNYSSLHEGIVTPVLDGINIYNTDFNNNSILAVDTVDNLGTIVTSIADKGIRVYRFILDEITNKVTEFKKIWEDYSVDYKKNDFGEANLSTVLYKELENVIKLYITTGTMPIITLRVDDNGLSLILPSQGVYTPVDYLINNRILPQSRVYIQDIISGRLKTQLVLYTYRYYNKHSNTTQLAPLTNKIQVIDPSRAKEIGNGEDTETSLGFTLSIDVSKYKQYYSRIQIYRLSYIKAGEDADVALIYDGKIKTDTNRFIFNDVGIEPLQTLTMEEFSAMSGLLLIPQTIDHNQNYMFCGNVTDDTILKSISLRSTPSKEKVFAKVRISDVSDGRIPYVRKEKFKNSSYDSIYSIGGNYIGTVSSYLEERGVNSNLVNNTYNDIMTSSLLRSLRRGETYRYGVVFYDKIGRRSDVINIGDVSVPAINTYSPYTIPFGNDAEKVLAYPIGVKISIPQPIGEGSSGIVGCQIVRRSSKDIYQNTLLQVALARPLSQGLAETEGQREPTKYSPFYPSGFLAVNELEIKPHYYLSFWGEELPELNATNKNHELFLIFSSEIDFRRDDTINRINISDTKLKEQFYLKGRFLKWDGNESYSWFNGLNYTAALVGYKAVIDRRGIDRLNLNAKQDFHYIFNFLGIDGITTSNFTNAVTVKNIKDVKMAEWNEGFSNVVREEDGSLIYDAIKQYKSFNTTIDRFTYNNWVSFGKFDLKPGTLRQPNNHGDAAEHLEFLATVTNFNVWFENFDPKVRHTEIDENHYHSLRNGYIGPGPSCFILTTETPTGTFPAYDRGMYTSVCNITHNPKLDGVEADENTQYFGFGNYFELKWENGSLKTKDGKDYMVVFDGDIYITPHEFTTLYKCYDFQSVDSLQSTQITNYIPLESKVNTCFDYGMNLVNTSSANLLYEPGTIDGVTSQERPVHQYNMIYSDNDASNDVFTLITTDPNETNEFKQRTYFSEPKTNGEFIDNFLIFKTASFIDVDSEYGQITNLYTDKNSLFYWQDHAFGKFSVNERSLINDQNGNTIMLGQAGILSRYDYLSTKYGMRLYDFCARSAEQGIYWVDINNKAVVAANQNQTVNFGEVTNVLNIINDKISVSIPKVDYDLQNNELLCKCLKNGEQLIFNTKYNFATSIYTRKYSNIAYIKNHIYGLYKNNNRLSFDRHNYIFTNSSKYLTPLIIEYVVNPAASITKVFDNQLFVPIKRDKFANASQILNKVKMAFETDIVEKTLADIEPYNDREGNITYVVPRYNTTDGYGNRIRGKWMKVNITNNNPIDYFTISHIITKYRQSFS